MGCSGKKGKDICKVNVDDTTATSEVSRYVVDGDDWGRAGCGLLFLLVVMAEFASHPGLRRHFSHMGFVSAKIAIFRTCRSSFVDHSRLAFVKGNDSHVFLLETDESHGMPTAAIAVLYSFEWLLSELPAAKGGPEC
jgi:hypothetical protein